MGESVSPASLAETPSPKSFAQRFAGVFFSPGPTFADVVRNPDYFAPLGVLVLSSVGVIETMLIQIGMERIVRASLEQSGRAASMSPEQVEQAITQGAKIGAIIAHVTGVIGAPLLLLIIAGLGLLIVNGVFGSDLNFRTAFAVACYARLVSVIGSLMAVTVILFADPDRFNPQNPAPSNVGFFLNPLETSKPLLALASSIDIITLWSMALLGIGFSEATGRKIKASHVFAAYFVLWLVIVLGRVGLAMLM